MSLWQILGIDLLLTVGIPHTTIIVIIFIVVVVIFIVVIVIVDVID